jgi:hypothetical protein
MTTEPRTTTAGDKISWRVSRFTDFPASAGWVLTYFFAATAETPARVTATPDEDAFLVTWTVGLKPGKYRWTAQVSKGDEKHTLDGGLLTVIPDPSQAYDRRSTSELALAAIEAVLAGRVSDPLAEYEIDGVKAKKIPPRDLLALRDRFRTEVRLQRGGPLVRRISVGGFW